MSKKMSQSAGRVRQALAAQGVEPELVEFPASTRTAEEAAGAIGCSVAQIAKSVVFCTRNSRRPVLVVASGANRINEAAVSERVGECIEMADASFVKEKTGFAIGGVPPVGHPKAIRTFVDPDLLELGDVWAAAGTPNAVFRTDGETLVKMTGGELLSVR